MSQHDISLGHFNCMCRALPCTCTVDRFFCRALIAINADGTTGLFFTTPQCHRWIAVQGTILQLIISTVDIVLMTRGTFFPLLSVSIRLITLEQCTRCSTAI